MWSQKRRGLQQTHLLFFQIHNDNHPELFDNRTLGLPVVPDVNTSVARSSLEGSVGQKDRAAPRALTWSNVSTGTPMEAALSLGWPRRTTTNRRGGALLGAARSGCSTASLAVCSSGNTASRVAASWTSRATLSLWRAMYASSSGGDVAPRTWCGGAVGFYVHVHCGACVCHVHSGAYVCLMYKRLYIYTWIHIRCW